MWGDRGGDRKGNLWRVGKAKHGRKGVTRQTQQNVQQVLQQRYAVDGKEDFAQDNFTSVSTRLETSPNRKPVESPELFCCISRCESAMPSSAIIPGFLHHLDQYSVLYP